MNTSPYAAHQPGFSSASYTVSSDQGSPVRSVTTPFISGSIERMDSGTGQSLLTRNVQRVTEAETFGRELSQHGYTENAIHPWDNQAKQTPIHQQEKAESTLPALSVSDTRHHEGRSNPLNDPPILAACRHNRIAWLQELLAGDPALANRAAASGMRGESWVYPLSVAAHYGHIECIKALLSVPGILVNKQNSDGSTPLCLAAEYGHAECVKALLSVPGILVNEKNNDGFTPLRSAAGKGHAECVKVLLSAPGILVNEKGKYGETPLCLAAVKGHIECVKALLSAPGILVNEKDMYGATPLRLTAVKGHGECVKALLSAPGILVNEKDQYGETPLSLAACYGHSQCLKLLIDSQEMKITLLNAARDGQMMVLAEILDTLSTLEEPAKPEAIMQFLNVADGNGKTLLCLAAECGHENIVALFLDALDGLALEERLEATRAVLSAADRFGRTPLYMAARFGHDKIARFALHRLAEIEMPWAIPKAIAALVNTADLFGKTAVWQARSRGHLQIASLLTHALPDAAHTEGATRDALGDVVPLSNVLLRLNTLPKTARLNAVMAVLHHAREDVLLTLDVGDLESYDTLVVETLAALKRLPEAPEDASRNQAILKLMDCLCEDGETGFSYTCVANEGQEQVAELLQAFPILSAAGNGQTAIVTRILKMLATWPESTRYQAITTVLTNSRKDGGTALHIAAQSDQRAVVAHLLDTLDRMSESERSDAIQKVMHAVDDNGATPLHWAAFKGHHEVVGLLLNAVGRLPESERLEAFTAVVKAADQKGATALHRAATNGQYAVVEQFLNTVNGLPEAERMTVFAAMVGAVDTLKRTPLSAAIDYGHENIMNQLIQAFPLLSAIPGGHNQSVEQFMQALHALPKAARCSAIIAALKKTRADGATPLYIAASLGNIEIIKLLLGVGSTLLADGKQKEIREVLYSTCKVEGEDGAVEISPLRIAAKNGHIQAVTLLLEAIRELFRTT